MSWTRTLFSITCGASFRRRQFELANIFFFVRILAYISGINHFLLYNLKREREEKNAAISHYRGTYIYISKLCDSLSLTIYKSSSSSSDAISEVFEGWGSCERRCGILLIHPTQWSFKLYIQTLPSVEIAASHRISGSPMAKWNISEFLSQITRVVPRLREEMGGKSARLTLI